MPDNNTIKPKEREAVLRSLRSGVVPTLGLQHIQVGRKLETSSFLKDIRNVADGGTSFRIVIGDYGSGKTFFLSLARSMALANGLVTMNADLTPSRRLHGRDGQSRMLLSELITSMSTRTRQDGNALQNILDKFYSESQREAEQAGRPLGEVVEEKLSDLNEYAGGFPFAKVVSIYCRAYEEGDNALKNNAMRWLRCEYSTKTDAMRDLGVRDFINDNAFFSTIVLYSVLVRKAGYKGLYLCLDEMVNLYKITNTVSRKANYEEILNILNNTLQGNVTGLGVVMSGTPEFLTDPNRGLYSYEALRSRLAENMFSATMGLNDYNSTVLRLPALTSEELYVLLENLRNVFAGGDKSKYLVPDAALTSYLGHCSNKIGESYFRTPRNTIKGFIDLLSVLEQYPDRSWKEMIPAIEVEEDRPDTGMGSAPAGGSGCDADDFADFSL